MLKTCPFSGEKFQPKRRNQVFASSKNRRDYHNGKAAELRQIKAPINRYLDRNLLILSQLVCKGESKTLKMADLVSMGFNPNVFTHIEEYNGKMCRCVFQFIIPQSSSIDTIAVIHPNHD
jgi:hypothetical protein